MDAKIKKALALLNSTCDLVETVDAASGGRQMVRCTAAELMRWIKLSAEDVEAALDQFVRETAVGQPTAQPVRKEWAKQQLAFASARLTLRVAMLNLLIQERRDV